MNFLCKKTTGTSCIFASFILRQSVAAPSLFYAFFSLRQSTNIKIPAASVKIEIN